MAAGAVMALGFIGVPGVVMGWDDMDAAPIWIHAGGLSWAGTYILFPVWSITLGRALTRPAQERQNTITTTTVREGEV